MEGQKELGPPGADMVSYKQEKIDSYF